MDTAPPVATTRALMFVGGAFYLSGGFVAVCIAWLAADVQHRTWIAGIGATAIVLGALAARLAGHMRLPVRVAMNVCGTSLVLTLVLLGGATTGGEALFWLFCYVPIDSFFFFPWRLAIPLLGWGFVATAVAVFGSHIISEPEWFVMSVVAVVVAFAIGWLIRSAADAEWDGTTGMLSRKGLDREMATRCAQTVRTGRPYAVATVSIAGVDRIAAGQGRGAAEPLVRDIGRRLAGTRSGVARWARLRDTEFAVLWDDSAGFVDYLEQVCKAARPAGTLSIGVADCHPGNTPHEMLASAIVGRKFSERTGGGVKRSGLVAEAVADLRRALRTGEIDVYYQPIVDLDTGTLSGAEALARWVHAERGLVPPAEFIQLAEESGLTVELGAHVLRRACQDAARWSRPERAKADPKVTVNVSGPQFVRPEFADVVAAALHDSGLPPERLVLELTESTVEANDPTARQALTRLRSLGVRIAVDDFGTGYSNLSRLAFLPVDVLKVDQSFVAGTETSPRAREMLRALVGFARALRLTTVVEGIENGSQAHLVRSAGAHEGQGWLFGRPVPNSAFALAPPQVPAREADDSVA